MLAGCATATPADMACAAKGGRIVAYAMFTRTCQWPATDAGKACSDNRECEGICKLPDDAYDVEPVGVDDMGVVVEPVRLLRIPKAGTPVTGICSAVRRDINEPNCIPYVREGKVALAGCVD